eukprot:CAMPEP_0198113298 /NCGR_PEP_ID=MMETSP1442-20131203/5004_1 /TAXON_ID= /ORGANISM="Craspedostauros australis, Strain CCMP3328" /LENGTH=379 /DNA_ID=CAMNT_0043770355 /DNA_START=24 /DNA_END=1160 /DNA_ORIENTATION=+
MMMSTLRSAALRRVDASTALKFVASTHVPTAMSARGFSSNNNNSKKHTFKPRRPASKKYRPIHAKPKKTKGPKHPHDISKNVPNIDMSNLKITDMDPHVDDAELDQVFGGAAADAIRHARREMRDGPMDLEMQLKMADYLTSPVGSTEDLVGERRALALDAWDHEDRDEILKEINDMIEKVRVEQLELEDTVVDPATLAKGATNDDENSVPVNRLAHGDWGEMVVRTDRVRKMWRGGRIESFRALVIGGNLTGCGGFGVGKSFEPEDAVELACRMARRNIFFVDRYRNRGITRDLVGRQNNCRVQLRSTDNGLRGNPLCCEILKLMGITNVVAKAHGPRNHYNVVRATFKALMTHESLEDISMKRGVRLVNLQKAKRLQ